MKTIDIIPKIYQETFMARIVMRDYDITTPLAISIMTRRSDGMYQKETIQYPDPKYTEPGEILVPFFAMTKSCVAQIVGVKVNNVDINTYFTNCVFDSERFMIRYDDNLASLDDPTDTTPIDLKFHVYSDGDPMKLIVVDESSWGALRDYPSMIHIKMPGFKDVLDYYLSKNQVNVFNSITLGLNCVEPGEPLCFMELPDGMYDITIRSGDFYCNKKYLKTDKIQLDIDKIYARSCLACNALSDDLLQYINEAELLMRGAEANTRLGNFESAHMLIDRVALIVERASKCKQCK